MIAQTVRQIREYRGAMLVASTGLGKTVVATHVALNLAEADEITNVMVISPRGVQNLWRKEMRAASIAGSFFTHQALDKQSADQDSSLTEFDEIGEGEIDAQWLVIIDESHIFRNQYSAKGRERGAFARLLPMIEQSGCKVLLLTGSPYSTGDHNINDQLLLLPHHRSQS